MRFVKVNWLTVDTHACYLKNWTHTIFISFLFTFFFVGDYISIRLRLRKGQDKNKNGTVSFACVDVFSQTDAKLVNLLFVKLIWARLREKKSVKQRQICATNYFEQWDNSILSFFLFVECNEGNINLKKWWVSNNASTDIVWCFPSAEVLTDVFPWIGG